MAAVWRLRRSTANKSPGQLPGPFQAETREKVAKRSTSAAAP